MSLIDKIKNLFGFSQVEEPVAPQLSSSMALNVSIAPDLLDNLVSRRCAELMAALVVYSEYNQTNWIRDLSKLMDELARMIEESNPNIAGGSPQVSADYMNFWNSVFDFYIQYVCKSSKYSGFVPVIPTENLSYTAQGFTLVDVYGTDVWGLLLQRNGVTLADTRNKLAE